VSVKCIYTLNTLNTLNTLIALISNTMKTNNPSSENRRMNERNLIKRNMTISVKYSNRIFMLVLILVATLAFVGEIHAFTWNSPSASITSQSRSRNQRNNILERLGTQIKHFLSSHYLTISFFCLILRYHLFYLYMVHFFLIICMCITCWSKQSDIVIKRFQICYIFY
jgi:hypothetical protein